MRSSAGAPSYISAVPSILFALLLALCAQLVQPSRVQAQPRCGDADPEISISLCSAIIQSGRARGRELAVAHTERGVAYVSLLDYDRALRDFAEAITIDRSFARAFANRGAVYGAKQDFDKAIEDFTQVLKLDPASAPAFSDRAGMHRLNGQQDEAIRDYTEAIRLDPAFADAILNRAITLAGTSRCKEAVADFTRAIELNPIEPVAHVDRGVCHEAMGRDDLALQDYSAHLALQPRSRVRPRAACRAVLPRPPVRSRARRLRTSAHRQSELGGGVVRPRRGAQDERRRASRRSGYGNRRRDAARRRRPDGRAGCETVAVVALNSLPWPSRLFRIQRARFGAFERMPPIQSGF